MVKKCSIIVSGTIGVVLLLIGVFSPMVMDTIIKSQAQKKVILSSDTEGLWSKIPGDSGVNIFRNFSFYDFKNPVQTIF